MDAPHIDEHEFLEAYQRYSDDLFRFCIIKVRNRDEALDIVQDTFTKTWQYITAGKTIESIRPFLYRVARNLIIDESRKKKMQSLDVLYEEGFDVPTDRLLQAKQDEIDGRAYVKILKKLDNASSEVLMMRYIEGLEISEIAEILGESPNTITVRIHRGIKQLQKYIQ